MIAHPVGRYLVEFGAEEEPEIEVDDPFVSILQPIAFKIEEFQNTHETLLEIVREEGRAEAREIAQAELQTALLNLQASCDQHLEEQRQSWITEESTKLGIGLSDAMIQMEMQISEALDMVLRPFLIETLRRQMIDELASNVNILLASESPVIEISGAADLIAALQEKLAAAPVAINYKPDESTDVRIVAHHTIIESQLGAWIERFDPSREQN